MAVVYVPFLAILISLHKSEIINCDSSRTSLCGPCQQNECEMQCSSRKEVCLESILLCSSNSNCKINCHAFDYACLEAVINAASVNNFALDCGSKYSCEAMTVNLNQAKNVTINCGGTEMSCKDLRLNAVNSEDIVVNCHGIQSCNGMIIHGGKDVTVNCADSNGNACYGLTLICGHGQCLIDCQGPKDKCLSITVDTSLARKFSCIGSPSDCVYAPMPFSIPTVSPSKSPSKHPTYFPSITTLSPTLRPTKTTNAPTKYPSLFPSNSPTNKPSPSPSIKLSSTLSVDRSDTTTNTPSLSQSASSNIIPTTTFVTTAYPTVNQYDGSICCQCLDAATATDKKKGCQIDMQCQQIICDFDNYCCETLWDKTCTFYASEQCEKSIETTQQIFGQEQEVVTDFNLIWKFGLVVLAVMVLIVSCCLMLIHIHKICKKSRREKKMRHQQRQIKQNRQMKRAKSEIIAAPKKEAEGKRVVRIKTSISHNRGHQRMRSTDNYAVRMSRYEHAHMDMAEDESDDLKHDDINDEAACLGMATGHKHGKQSFVVDDSLSNSESPSLKKKRKEKRRKKKKKKGKKRSKKKKRKNKKSSTKYMDDDSATISSDNDDEVNTEICLKIQRSFSHSMLKRHSI